MTKLLSLVERMQGMATAYLVPETYIQRTGNDPMVAYVAEEGTPEKSKLFAADIIYMLDGPEQREAFEEAKFDYVAETDVTASDVWGGDNASADLLLEDLRTFVTAAKRLDQHKKVLFRKRSNEEAGLPSFDGTVKTPVSFYFIKQESELLHGIVGVATEAGELAEIAIKKLEYPSPADVTNVREEIGDVLWYLARLVKFAGTTFLAEQRRNIAKLRERHGSRFNAERDVNRNLSAERAVLEESSK